MGGGWILLILNVDVLSFIKCKGGGGVMFRELMMLVVEVDCLFFEMVFI